MAVKFGIADEADEQHARVGAVGWGVAEAVTFLKHEELIIEPRKMWPAGLFPDVKPTIPLEQRLEPGRALCYYGDAGWGRLVKENKYGGARYSDDLLKAAIEKAAGAGSSLV
jgi:hypothetical protein